jgi:pilus assembly protein CpaE
MTRIADFRRAVGAFRQRQDGVSAVEFALVAPVMIGALLGMVDIGMAINERMSIDHVVRAAAQVAISDPGAATVQQVLEDLSAGKGYIVVADYYCPCPGNEACAEPCSDPAEHTGYVLRAETTYVSMITPLEIPMESVVRVQVQ